MSATHDSIDTQPHKDPDQLEREISQQRRHIEDIVQALESKLSPGEMFERVLNFSKGSGREFAGNLGTTVKANPVPALLAVASLAWLYASSRQTTTGVGLQTGLSSGMSGGLSDTMDTGGSNGSQGLSQRVHAVKASVGDKAHGAMESIRSGARSATDSVRGGARSATGAVRGGVSRASDGYGTMLRDNPLAAGAIAVAVGALFGALMPPTRKEDELLGEASDRMIDRVKSKAREQKDALAQRARDMAQPASGGRGSSSGLQDDEDGTRDDGMQSGLQRLDDVPTTETMAGGGPGGGTSSSQSNGAPGAYGAH